MAETGTFLSGREVAELTGITRGKTPFTREQLQAKALSKMKIPHFVNPAGYPKVVRAVIEGGRATPAPAAAWEPRVAY